jgi:hypothetical protein
MCDFEMTIKALEMEHRKRLFFKTKFKVVRGFGLFGLWARVMVSSSENRLEQLAFEFNEINYLDKDPQEIYSFMISEWKRFYKNKGQDFFQAEWERVNA